MTHATMAAMHTAQKSRGPKSAPALLHMVTVVPGPIVLAVSTASRARPERRPSDAGKLRPIFQNDVCSS